MQILAILSVVLGIFGIWNGINIEFILSGGELTLVSSLQLGALLIGIFQIIAGLGLWKLKSWAWYLVLFVTIIGLLLNLGIVILDFSLFSRYLLTMLVRAIIIAYLMKKSIKQQFR